jgi:hypothetical protein
MNTIRNIVGVEPKETRHSFFELSLCLSRACLGKMIAFYIEKGAKVAFLYQSFKSPAENAMAFQSAFPMFVPSLSWQICDCLSIKCR